MKDSINQKAQQAAMVETSGDRNGVVVNRATDSTRGILNCLVEQRCIKAKNRSSQIDAKSEAHGASLHYSTALVRWYRYAQNPDFYSILQQRIASTVHTGAEDQFL